MHNTSPIYSCKPQGGIAYEPSSVTKLFNAILKAKFVKNMSTRVVINDNKYIYYPTDEYRKFVFRFKKIK
jgi:phage pi2 protein 07